MKTLTRLKLKLRKHKHTWEMPDGSYPTHGYDDIPYAEATCNTCGQQA